jgi:hypothetical protein
VAAVEEAHRSICCRQQSLVSRSAPRACKRAWLARWFHDSFTDPMGPMHVVPDGLLTLAEHCTGWADELDTARTPIPEVRPGQASASAVLEADARALGVSSSLVARLRTTATDLRTAHDAYLNDDYHAQSRLVVLPRWI